MIIAQWTIVLPEDKLDEFVTFWHEKIKPFWLAHGCASASIFQSMNRQYFPYQIIEDRTTVTEQLAFNTLRDLEEYLAFNSENEEAQEITVSYERRFAGKDPTFRVFEKI